MLNEMIAVVGMANETNRLVEGYQVEVDEFLNELRNVFSHVIKTMEHGIVAEISLEKELDIGDYIHVKNIYIEFFFSFIIKKIVFY